jgi:hypothetical protein
MGNELIRERGDFNNQLVFGFFKPTIEASLPTTSWYGMRIDLYSMNTILTDEEGHLWYLLRFHDHANSPAFRVRTNGYGSDLYHDLPDIERGYTGPIRHRVEGDAHIAESTQDIPGKQPYRFTRWVDRMEWSEGDLCSLTGVATCPVMSYFAPDPKGGWGFTSNVFRVEGTLMGRKVRGFCEYASCWAAPGVSNLEATGKHYRYWMILANQYEDGTYDVAHIGHMQGEGQFAMVANEKGPCLATRDVKLAVELDEGGNRARYPKAVHLELAGEKWRWNPVDDSKVDLPPVVGGVGSRGVASREGYAQRVGDTRKLAYGWLWLNMAGDSRIDPFVINKA